MKYPFDELAKSLAQSVTRRQAFKKFGVGIAGMALACFGLSLRAGAKPPRSLNGYCVVFQDWSSGTQYAGTCLDPTTCQYVPTSDCPTGRVKQGRALAADPCNPSGFSGIDTKARCAV